MSFHHKHHHHRRQPNALGNVLNNDITRLNDGVERVESNVATLVSVVYVTATPTFNGPVAGYTTIVPVSAVQASTTESPAPAASTAAAETSALAIFSALAQSFSSQSTSIDVALITTATTAQVAASSLSLVDSVPVTTFSAFSPSSTLSSTSSILVSAAVPASATSSLGSAGVTQDSAGLAGGAKAGIAIAVLLAVLSLLALLGFCYRRKRTRRNEAYAVTGNEKNPFGDRAAAPVLARASTPSQLSLRPQDELAMPAAIDNTRRSKDLEKAQARVEHSANPFGPHAEVSQVNQEIPAPLRIRTTTPESVPLAAEAGIVAATASATVAQRHNAPKALDIKRAVSPIPHIPIGSAMPSPSGTEYSMTSVAAGTMASGPPPANVYRIQLDFKPSMEDELELNAGQLVRLLHEYDDGWALCIRLDRSQQGVAPRTCLSARPVKPRSNAPGTTLPGMWGATQGSSASSRNASPAPAHRAPRSMSPSPYGSGPQEASSSSLSGQRRSVLASDVRETRSGPLGPSPMNPNAMATSQGTQDVPRMLPQAGNIPQPTATPPKSSHGVARKPVPGRSM